MHDNIARLLHFNSQFNFAPNAAQQCSSVDYGIDVGYLGLTGIFRFDFG